MTDATKEEAVELFDIGANLGHEAFAHDLEAVVERARDSGVRYAVVTACSLSESAKAIRIAHSEPGVLWATAGVHPHAAHEWTEETADRLRTLLSDPKVVAIGEAGLDFHRNLSPRTLQVRALEAQLQLAEQAALPLFLHVRDAHDSFAAIVRSARSTLGKIVVHCFTGDEQQLRTYLDLDLHIGITGWICDERRGHHLRELVRFIPMDRLMLETDSPYLLPRDLIPRPAARRNEPMFLKHIARSVAACYGCSLSVLAAATTSTARVFFGVGEQVSETASTVTT